MDSEGKRRTIRIGVWVAILGLLLGVLGSIVMATGAEAHATLRSVSPRDGATVGTAPTEVVLTFDEAIGTSFATVAVAGPGGAVNVGKAVVDGATVTQALATDLPNGKYTISFHVVSDDGHPVSDRSTFTVAVAATPTTSSTAGEPTATPLPATTASPTTATGSPSGPAAADTPEDAGNGRALRIGLAIGVAALALAGGTALVASARRRSGE
jgi:copper resistance protein C